MEIQASPKGRVLDIGAGVSVVPLWLALLDIDVVTIDYSPHQRNPDNKSGWNEWGYLDYSALDTRIVSHNADAQTYEPDQPFDAIYSISVLEHMPADVRRNILNKTPGWLAPRGRLLISLDLTPATDDLWPLSEGQIVDRAQPHGTLHDVTTEIRQAGLRIVEVAIRRGIPESRTDVAFIEAAMDARESAIFEAAAQGGRADDAEPSAELVRVAGELARVTQERDAILQSATWKATWIVRAGGSRLPPWARRALRGGMKLTWWTVTLQVPRKLRARHIKGIADRAK